MKFRIFIIFTAIFLLGACKPVEQIKQPSVASKEQLIKLFGSHIAFDRCQDSEFVYLENIKVSGVQNEEGLFINYNNSELRLVERLQVTSVITEAFLNNDALYIDFKGKLTGWMLDSQCAGRYYSGAFFSKHSDLNIVDIKER